VAVRPAKKFTSQP